MSFRSNILSQKKAGSSGGPNFLPTTNGAILGFSFRQLRPEATFALRQYKAHDKLEFQDVGFVNGVLDIDSVLTFANGGNSYYEQYNQFDNTLRYVKYGAAPLPRLTTTFGLFYRNNKISGEFAGVRLIATGITLGSQVVTFQVNDGAGDAQTQRMLNSTVSPTGYMGVLESGAGTSAYTAGGTPTFWKNQAQITPVNRGSLYTALNPFHSQHTIKDMNLNRTTLIKGINGNSVVWTALLYSQEELWYDQSVMTAGEISSIEQNQMEYYLT